MNNTNVSTAAYVLSENVLMETSTSGPILTEASSISHREIEHIVVQDNDLSEAVRTSSLSESSEPVTEGPIICHPSISIESMNNAHFLTHPNVSEFNACENENSTKFNTVSTTNPPIYRFKTNAPIVKQPVTAYVEDVNNGEIKYVPANSINKYYKPAAVTYATDTSKKNNFPAFTVKRSVVNSLFNPKAATFKIVRADTSDNLCFTTDKFSVNKTVDNTLDVRNDFNSSIPEEIGIELTDPLITEGNCDAPICSRKSKIITPASAVDKSPVAPPLGSISRLARNATLIDLSKIKKNRGQNKQIRIDDVVLSIDDYDNVKVVDYGPSTPRFNDHQNFFSPKKLSKSRRNAVKITPQLSSLYKNNDHSFNSGNNFSTKSINKNSSNVGGTCHFYEECHDFEEDLYEDMEQFEKDSINDDPLHQQFEDPNLCVSLEHMRHLRVDCNVALVDPSKQYIVYAHRVVLVSRSPFFYKNLYLRRKKLNFLHQFCRFTLPHQLNLDAVEAVVSYMYSSSLDVLLGCCTSSSNILKVLHQFEMGETEELYAAHMPPEPVKVEPMGRRLREIKTEPDEDDVKSELLEPFFEYPPAEEVTIDERKKRRKSNDPHHPDKRQYQDSGPMSGFILNASGEEVRMKSSVQKLVESALNPFLCKLEELFDPNSTTMQVARASQHIITLWNADLLLTKLFNQNELTKYFTDCMNEVMDGGSYKLDSVQTNVGSYVVETLLNTSGLEEVYTGVGTVDSFVPEVNTLTVGDMQIIDYAQMDPRHIPKYVRLISLYKFRIVIGTEESNEKQDNKKVLLNPLAQKDVASGPFQPIVEELDGNGISTTFNGIDKKYEEITRQCFKKVSKDLARRTILDLDTGLNADYQEEMIMHIIVEQMESERLLPLSIGIFLAKGCSFCKKRECKSEDLYTPIGPDNPVCPDRQCIKKNLICQICNKQMANSKSLARHKYSVHDVQSGETAGMFICSHCGETFSKKWKLNVHEKQHEDRKLKVTCHICNKLMRGAIALKKHINMVHETKRQYMCEHCHKMFKRKETLLVHRRIHTGEKPFVCSHCDYSSETKGNLKAHTWRKHKRPLLATSVGNNGIETSITGPVATMEEFMADEEGDGRVGASVSDAVSAEMVLEGGQVLELEGPVSTMADDHKMAATLVAHAHLQEPAFIMS